VHDERDVHIFFRREAAEALQRSFLRIEAFKAPAGGAAEHELQVVDHDVLHIVRVRRVLHRVEDFVDVRCAEKVHEVNPARRA
jgi:hypothetical protein